MMARVSIVLLPSLAETIGCEANFTEVIPNDKDGEGGTVADLLDGLASRYYRFRQLVFDIQSRRMTGETLVFLNGRILDQERGLQTVMSDGDTLTFVPFVEGG
jgi:molybdopterin converting factor small subunit